MMTKKTLRLSLGLTLALFMISCVPALAQSEVIKLPQPDLSRGKTLMQALQDRKSDRIFSPKELSRQQLSEIVWAAAGVNRKTGEEKMGRTAPSSHNDQAVDTYAFTRTGVYKYDHVQHELVQILAGDHRAKAGVQSYVANAPLNLLFVADMSKISGDTDRDKLTAACMDVGHMSENVYLYGASSDLNVICRSTIDHEELRFLLKLGKHFEPLLGVTVGHPQ